MKLFPLKTEFNCDDFVTYGSLLLLRPFKFLAQSRVARGTKTSCSEQQRLSQLKHLLTFRSLYNGKRYRTAVYFHLSKLGIY